MRRFTTTAMAAITTTTIACLNMINYVLHPRCETDSDYASHWHSSSTTSFPDHEPFYALNAPKCDKKGNVHSFGQEWIPWPNSNRPCNAYKSSLNYFPISLHRFLPVWCQGIFFTNTVFYQYIPIEGSVRSYDRLISTMVFPIVVRRHLYIELECGTW